MRMSEDTDFTIGKHQPAEQIIVKVAFNRPTERFFYQAAPRFLAALMAVEAAAEAVSSLQRLQQRFPSLLGEDAGERVEAFHPVDLGLTAGEFADRAAADFLRDIAQEEAAVASIPDVWR